MEILTDREGADFAPTLREVCTSVQHAWFVNMPPSVSLGNQGTNTVEFHVLRDGTISKDSVKMVIASGKSDLDAASLKAIRGADPVSHLPEKFSQSFIVLRLTFHYNISTPKQK